MGAETVNAPERWRFWLDSGLGHVLGPLPWVDAARQARTCEAAAAASGFGRKNAVMPVGVGPGIAVKAAGQAREAVGGPAAASGEMNPWRERATAQNAAGSAKSYEPAAAPRSSPGTPLAEPQRPMPSDSWPAAWRKAWSKTGFARPFLWTYEQLGQDLLGTPDPDRREILRQVLVRLNLGPVHNFWPFSEPDGQDGLRLQPRLFKEGLKHLAPKCVIFLGPREIEGITPPGAPELFKVVSYFNSGVLCVHAPEIGELAADPALLDAMAVLFQQKLSHLI